MKKIVYVSPIVEKMEVEIEKGFATSGIATGDVNNFGINQLQYDNTGIDSENTAW